MRAARPAAPHWQMTLVWWYPHWVATPDCARPGTQEMAIRRIMRCYWKTWHHFQAQIVRHFILPYSSYCSMPMTQPSHCRGPLVGSIATAPRGDGGFGYDPLFIPDGESRHAAELTAEEKNLISHRGKALTRLIKLAQA